MRRQHVLFSVLVLVAAWAPLASAQLTAADTLQAVAPGLVYREYSRAIGELTEEWRVTDPMAEYTGDPTNEPAAFLPNPVLEIDVPDLQGAVRAVVVIDTWGGHVGTTGKQFRLNGNDWIDVPHIQNTPTEPECYTHQMSVTIEVPLEQLVEGVNTFEGLADEQICFNFDWGQWGWYGFMVRVYYDPATKSFASADMVSPASGATLRENPVLEVVDTGSVRIDRVDYVGYYADLDPDGDGVYLDWQQSHHRLRGDTTMPVRNFIGSVYSGPYRHVWDTSWVPDQDPGVMKLVARVQSPDGLWYVTNQVTDLTLDRPGVEVAMYPAANVPRGFWVRAGQKKYSQFFVPSGQDMTDAVAARMVVATWNGINGEAEPGEIFWTRVNGWTTPEFGEDHYYSRDVIDLPLSTVRAGTNTVEFYSQSSHHGCEILWPGPGVIVRYEDYASVAAYVIEQPQSLAAVADDSVSFRVRALGAEPIAFQWRRDGVDIPGAVDSVYVTPPLTLADDGAVYDCVVGNGNGGETSEAATLTVVARGQRSEVAPVALYDFNAGSGSVIADISGVEPAADLVIADPSAVRWLPHGLAIESPTLLSSPPAYKINYSMLATNEITVEAWVRPANLTQTGPARIVTVSSNLTSRNMTIGQGVSGGPTDAWDARLRTTYTSTNGTPSLSSAAGELDTVLTHVVFTRDVTGTTRLYLNGVETAAGTAGGDLSNWGTSTKLGVANELTSDRPWLGDIHLVAIYNQALDPLDVVRNYGGGPRATSWVSPVPDAGRFVLGANYPNPFNPQTVIAFELPATAAVKLHVYDVMGRKVATLAQTRFAAGEHRVNWDGRDDAGANAASGLYLYRLQATLPDGRTLTQSRSMTLVR